MTDITPTNLVDFWGYVIFVTLITLVEMYAFIKALIAENTLVISIYL